MLLQSKVAVAAGNGGAAIGLDGQGVAIPTRSGQT